MTSPIQVVPDPETLARAAADLFVEVGRAAVQKQERFSVALSGGSTPAALFRLLATPVYAQTIDWTKVHLFWGDERTVPPDHADSNYRMTREMLLDHVPIPPENVHRIQGELDPEDAARRYIRELEQHFGSAPRFDLVFLGMGTDGHTASLFPHTDAVTRAVTGDETTWVLPNDVPFLNTWRITLTAHVLNQASHLVFLVAGSQKAARLAQVLRGPYQPLILPSQLIRPTLWLIDNAAAGSLEFAKPAKENNIP